MTEKWKTTPYPEPELAPGYPLECPGCKNDFLHQGRVDVFNREEDEPVAQHTTVTRDGVSKARLVSTLNAPGRRHWLEISFQCETCDAAPILIVRQHKGSTYLSWAPPRYPTVAPARK